jgi:hypothetical protein
LRVRVSESGDLQYLKKVTCSSYIHGWSSMLGYFPNGGTMRLNTRAMQTNTAGRTICKEGSRSETHPSTHV